MMYLIVWLKLYSYHSVNYWCRLHQKKTHKRHNSGDSRQWNNHQHQHQNDNHHHHTDVTTAINQQLVQYPDNLTISDIYYFICVPTLCYELNFPRTERIRKRFLFKRLFEVVGDQKKKEKEKSKKKSFKKFHLWLVFRYF